MTISKRKETLQEWGGRTASLTNLSIHCLGFYHIGRRQHRRSEYIYFNECNPDGIVEERSDRKGQFHVERRGIGRGWNDFSISQRKREASKRFF